MTTETHTNFKNHFLIAMPQMHDPNFSHSLTYVFDHTEKGAMGIVVNKPSNLGLMELLNHLNITSSTHLIKDRHIHVGGPVHADRGFIFHNDKTTWDSTLVINENLSLTSSRDILEAIASGRGPSDFFIALGYAGWGAGQLENEFAHNAWLSTPADISLIFDCPIEQRWHHAAKLIGVDLNLLSTSAGHS